MNALIFTLVCTLSALLLAWGGMWAHRITRGDWVNDLAYGVLCFLVGVILARIGTKP